LSEYKTCLNFTTSQSPDRDLEPENGTIKMSILLRKVIGDIRELHRGADASEATLGGGCDPWYHSNFRLQHIQRSKLSVIVITIISKNRSS